MIEVALGLIALVIIVFTADRYKKFRNKNNQVEDEEITAPDDDCCGAHAVCDKTEEDFTSDPQLYFEDEELDNFRDYEPSRFTDIDIELFREVLYTLKPKEIVQWLYSLELRKVIVPGIIKEEARMLVEG